MKNMFKAAILAAGMFIAFDTHAQSVGQDVKKTAKKVGNKTAEIASKGKSAVVDKKYDGKVGPQGQTIYIDKNSYYYYVNKKGRHIYVKEADLVAKP
ncbi:hypothetical protein GCM10023149_53540 [Mucilaginibacter gynuensis]|uniref:PBCV-specific basic adaptor domain-containing protein n=1 Tax=Mucilaginibacter gynuensis TaxID=1302236 RepID=A0ABP8HMC8_9SPHI